MKQFVDRSILKLNAAERAAFWLWRRVWRARIKRHMRREGSGLAGHFQIPASLKREHVANCKVYANRELMLADWPRHARIAEVGTFAGLFAATILRTCAPQELHLFDRSTERAEAHPQLSKSSEVKIHRGDSWSELDKFADGYFDVIYLDADHRLRGIARDAQVAVRKLRRDGLLIFDDYTIWSPVEMHDYGVVHVVNWLCVEDGWEIAAFAFQELNYFNVALRRRNSN